MSTELQPIERAEKVLGFVERKAQLAELAGRSSHITEITNPAGFQECHAARMRLKNMRVDIEKAGKAAREDANAFSKAVIAKEKELIGVIEPEESRLEQIQDAFEAKRAAEKAERERVERERIAAIWKRIDEIKDRPLAVVGQPADVIARAIEDLRQTPIDDLPDEYQAEARQAVTDADALLVELHTRRVAADVEAGRLAQERAELERRKREQDERDRAAREQREREEAEHRARLDAEERERREQEERERAERQRQEDAARAEREREQKEADERRRAEDERLRVEREAIDRERAAARQREQDKEIAEATLYGAACEAVDLLRERGLGDNIVTLKLDAALRREKPVKEAA